MRYEDINWRAPGFRFADIQWYIACKPWSPDDRRKLIDICRNGEVPWSQADREQLISILKNLNCQDMQPKPYQKK